MSFDKKKTKKNYKGGFVLLWRYNRYKKKWEADTNHQGREFNWWNYQTCKFERFVRNTAEFIRYIPICIKNFFFCLKYPFWRSRNVWTGKFGSYRWTWYDDIEVGWRKAFGKQLSHDIKAAFKEDKKRNSKLKWKDALYWEQIKEKYATLRLYATATKNIMDVLSHYEDISESYCIRCGKPSQYECKGWILPYCSECFDDAHNKEKVDEVYEGGYIAYKEHCKFNCDPAPEKVIPLYVKKKKTQEKI